MSRRRWVNTLRPRQNGCHFPDIFKYTFLNGNVWISTTISLDFVPKGPINNIPALVQIMAWHWPGNKPLSEPMIVILLMHVCVTQPQWVKHNPGQVLSQNQPLLYHVQSRILTLQYTLSTWYIIGLSYNHLHNCHMINNTLSYWGLVTHLYMGQKLGQHCCGLWYQAII